MSYVRSEMVLRWYFAAIFFVHSPDNNQRNEFRTCYVGTDKLEYVLDWAGLRHGKCQHDRYTYNGHQSKYLWSNKNTTRKIKLLKTNIMK